jgi:hypothetical protein
MSFLYKWWKSIKWPFFDEKTKKSLRFIYSVRMLIGKQEKKPFYGVGVIFRGATSKLLKFPEMRPKIKLRFIF